MTTATLIFGALLVAGIAWAWSFYNNSDRRTKRGISKLDHSDIASLKDNTDVRLSGDIQGLSNMSLIRSPLSGQECVGWRLRIERGYRRKGGGHDWSVVVDEHEVVDFLIVDKTGKAQVLSSSVELALKSGTKERTSAKTGLDPRLEELLAAHGVASETGWGQDAQFRYEETHLMIGDVVSVAGSGQWRDSEESAYRGAQKCFLLGPASNGRLLVSNDMDVET